MPYLQDTYASLKKQNLMLKMVLSFYHEAKRALDNGVYLEKIVNLDVRNKIARAKYLVEEEVDQINDIIQEIKDTMDQVISEGGILDA